MNAIKEINDKVDHNEECPNEGHHWGCCCKCVYQMKLHVCGCGKCPAVIEGYACIGVSMAGGDEKEDLTGNYTHRKHGQCEIFTEKNKYELTLIERKDDE